MAVASVIKRLPQEDCEFTTSLYCILRDCLKMLFINAEFAFNTTYKWTLPHLKLLTAVLFIIAINWKQRSCCSVGVG